jgi:hypothetical protein
MRRLVANYDMLHVAALVKVELRMLFLAVIVVDQIVLAIEALEFGSVGSACFG